MTLADYIYDQNMTPTELRRLLGVSKAAVWRYLLKKQMPRPQHIQRILEITRNAVTLQDLIGDDPPECAIVTTNADGTPRWVLPWSPDYARLAEAIEREEPRNPIQRALTVLGPRAELTTSGAARLNGRPIALKALVRHANLVLRQRGEDPIAYPGVEPLYD